MLEWKGVDLLWKTIQRMILATTTATQTAMKMVQIYGNALVQNVLNESAARAVPRGPRVPRGPLGLRGQQGHLEQQVLQAPPGLWAHPDLPGPQVLRVPPARLAQLGPPGLRAHPDLPGLRVLQVRPARLVRPGPPGLRALRVPPVQQAPQAPPGRQERPLL